jgi:hypothetical protein
MPERKIHDDFELKLEVREGAVVDVQPLSPLGCLITPAIGEDFWLFRVRVSEKQAILGFPKFGVLGVGFALEEDWNTNLPSGCQAQEIMDHIRVNKGDDSIPDERCIRAIEMIQQAWVKVNGKA